MQIVTGGIAEALNFLRDTYKNVHEKIDAISSQNTDSLVRRSKLVRVEPMCIIDSNLKANEVTTDIQQACLTMFAGFYVQAFALSELDAEMHISNRLEPFKTEQDLHAKILGTEQFTIKQSLDKVGINPFTGQKVSSASTEDNDKSNNQTVKYENVVKELKETSTLSIGKIVTLTFKSKVPNARGDYQMAQVPIGIKLIGSYLETNKLAKLLSFSAQDISAFSRKLGYQSGRLKFWSDIIFCRDVYSNFRRSLMMDKTGFFKNNLDKQSNNVIIKWLFNNRSTSGISTIVVASKQAIETLETLTDIKIDNYKQRNELFERSGTMILAVVDEDYRMVKFYYHSIEKALEATFSELKRSSGKSETDISSIVNALTMGNAPRLF